LYTTQSGSARRLEPWSGAAFAAVGNRTSGEFDRITIEDLQALSYSGNPIDMSDTSSNLQAGFAFAIRTALGRYVKLRITDNGVISRVGDDGQPRKDLALEMFVYR